jgi:16S rRNA (guanine527-N7)-methyltransferase
MTSKPSQLLADGAGALGVPLSPVQLTLFERYVKELLDWNERFNLTAITNEEEIVVKHFLDSLALLGKVDIPPGARVVDIGSGAGFPGLVLKIARPDILLTLLESSNKKATFLRHASEALALDGVEVAAERAEDFAKNKKNRQSFDFALSRAVADVAVLAEYGLPLIKLGGKLVCYKARGAEDEARGAEKALILLGGCVEELAKVVVPFLQAERYLVVIRKTAETPPEYPRKAGLPAKRPLK